jgi:ADP-heptose:LPS heptosyltransferase
MADATASRDERAALEPGKTVVLCLDTLGDLTLRQPLFRGLLDAGFPTTLVVRRGYETLVPFLDPRLEVLVTEVNPYGRREPPPQAVIDELHERIAALGPAILVSALYDHTEVDDALLARFAGRRVGLVNPRAGEGAEPRRRPLDRPVACAEETHESEKSNALLRAMTGRGADPYSPTLSLTAEARARAEETLAGLELKPRRYVLGNPAGTAQTSLKAWPAEGYAVLVEHLARKHGLPVLLTGIPSEAAHLAEVAADCAARGAPVKTWIGDAGTLGVLLGLIQGARLYLGADTGPMHFAGALGVPVVARFGGGHWPRFLPLARRSYVGTQDVPCFGCGWACWMDEPVCVRHGSAQPYQDALDWILSGDEPERRVDTGETIGPAAEAALRAARAAKARAVDELTGKWQAADEYRTWLEGQYVAVEGYSKRLEAEIGQRDTVIQDVAAQLTASEADRLARGTVIEAQARLLRPFPVRALLKILGWLRVV